MSRAGTLDHVPAFLAAASRRPAALVIEGEAGIGKTTMWLSALEKPHEQRFLVLSARASDEESMPTYAAVADLIGDVDPQTLDAALFISPKTVQHNLGRVYRKLGIRHRAEPGRRIGRA